MCALKRVAWLYSKASSPTPSPVAQQGAELPYPDPRLRQRKANNPQEKRREAIRRFHLVHTHAQLKVCIAYARIQSAMSEYGRRFVLVRGVMQQLRRAKSAAKDHASLSVHLFGVSFLLIFFFPLCTSYASLLAFDYLSANMFS